ncbi:MAG: thioredoxin family protein [Rikenellaceae bacterium]
MALVMSSTMELGTVAPDFTLMDVISDKTKSLSELKSEKATIIMFICNHCPFVHHINHKLVEIANLYQSKGMQFIAISSNDVNAFLEDSPMRMKVIAMEEKYPFPYLYDETQEVAKAYMAECTPEFFVFDSELKCVYRGRFDETRPEKGAPTGKDLTDVLDAIIDGSTISVDQKPSIGCSIKWK